MTNIEDQLDDIADVTVGGGGGGHWPRDKTVVSVINGGEHLCVYPAAALCEVMQTWLHGAHVRIGRKDGKPKILIFEAGGSTSLRKKGKSGQRPHLAVPTARIGKIDGSAKGIEVESCVEGDKIYVQIGQFYADKGEQQ
jgi:hypothetical protein